MRLTHVRLLVSDTSASYRFYRNLLGLPTTWEENPGYAEFEVGPECALAIFPRAEMGEPVVLRHGEGDGAVVVLSVAGRRRGGGPLRSAGVEVSDPRDRPDWGVAHLRDPDGNPIELYHDIEWTRGA